MWPDHEQVSARPAVKMGAQVPVWKLERWRQRALAGIEAGLRKRDDDPTERELAEAHRRIGELSSEPRCDRPDLTARTRSVRVDA